MANKLCHWKIVCKLRVVELSCNCDLLGGSDTTVLRQMIGFPIKLYVDPRSTSIDRYLYRYRIIAQP